MLERIRRAWRWWLNGLALMLEAHGVYAPGRPRPLRLCPPMPPEMAKAPPHPYRAPGACTCERVTLEERIVEGQLQEMRAEKALEQGERERFWNRRFRNRRRVSTIDPTPPTMGDVARGELDLREFLEQDRRRRPR